MIIKSLIAASAALLALHAGATTVDWHEHDTVEYAAFSVTPGSFLDTVNFTTDYDAILSTTVSNNLSSLLQITDGWVRLYQVASGGGGDVLLGSYAFDGTTGSTSHTFALPGVGAYYYTVSGTATGDFGGLYSISSGVVPEPGALGMAVLGLGLTGALIRRRLPR